MCLVEDLRSISCGAVPISLPSLHSPSPVPVPSFFLSCLALVDLSCPSFLPGIIIDHFHLSLLLTHRLSVITMYTFKTLVVFFIIFASLVNALPAAHQRLRRSCPNKSSSSKSKATPNPVNNDAAVAKTKSATKSSSSSKSSAKPESKSTSPTLSTGTKLLSAVFPIGAKTGKEGWTTVSDAPGALPLSDSTFRPTKLLSDASHSYVTAPGGKKALKANYPKGSWTLGHGGGMSFYSPGPSKVDLTTAKEATLGYSVMFAKNFQWNKGTFLHVMDPADF